MRIVTENLSHTAIEIEISTWELKKILESWDFGIKCDEFTKFVIRGRHAGHQNHTLTISGYQEDFRGRRPKAHNEPNK